MEQVEIRQDGLRDNVRIQEAVKAILEEVGENPHRAGLERTPYRFAKACEEWFGGYNKTPNEVLDRTFKTSNKEMVIVKDISFYSFCEHHIAPFFGKVTIGYIPNGKVVGLDKLVKLVEIYAQRLQIQEQMTEQIADGLAKVLNPLGVMVIVKARHLCMSMRETRTDAETITSAVRGSFKQEITKGEMISLIKNEN